MAKCTDSTSSWNKSSIAQALETPDLGNKILGLLQWVRNEITEYQDNPQIDIDDLKLLENAILHITEKFEKNLPKSVPDPQEDLDIFQSESFITINNFSFSTF
ncbi:hypothetical protein GT348_01940 [Aristophania vespae]|uniref:Uncharacterized protein n=1 Tax=Aristophania vespae TaxID=2697033 RepID=A0A6P1N9W3_9PROT|nr:hypothetical protein [Aristophania vespae]QHI95206.1 hypothetical protein GT348_01940 [Aristophania vespae]UMM64438.1 hypothetical protein DM15PD_14520 [Aristophania vespae]